tara:strand:- start:164 stop:1192 length:1029 start_codon:yes stop_codon:yes gene_type:complete
MRKYLITGGFGFIGSNFIHHLIENELSNQIINIDKMTYAGNAENLRTIEKRKNYHYIHGDICCQKTVRKILEEYEPDVIVHFAAESHVDRSIDGPVEFFQTNVIGTLNLLHESNKWLKKIERRFRDNFRFIHISTDEVYGSLGYEGKFKENTAYDPSSPYSASKASSDHLVKSWYKTYDFPAIITNCSNNYGPYQFPEKLIPLVITNCLQMKNLPVYGKGTNVRDWLYVRDHCKAIQTVIDKGILGETYNIGGDNEITNIEIVETICDILDHESPSKSGESYKELIKYVKDRPGHDFRYAIDATKIRETLGWVPRESLITGLKKTILWYIQNHSWWGKIQGV